VFMCFFMFMCGVFVCLCVCVCVCVCVCCVVCLLVLCMCELWGLSLWLVLSFSLSQGSVRAIEDERPKLSYTLKYRN